MPEEENGMLTSVTEEFTAQMPHLPRASAVGMMRQPCW